MSPIRKIVPLVISSSKTPPDLIVHDDLVVFRAALNFVSTACSRTKIGSVRLNIHTLDDKLIFECRDTAPDVSARDSLIIFKSESSKGLQDASLGSLHIAASLIASVGGKSGFQPRDVSDGEVLYAGDRHHAGSIVWFSIPLGAQSPRGAATTVVVQESTGIGTDEIVITDTPTRDAQSLLQSSTGSHGKEKRLIPTGITCRSIRRERILDRVVAGSKFTDKTKSSAQTATGAKVRLKKALVIDDCLVVRKGMGRALSKLGCEVTLAENGMEGLQELKKTIFDFSLCDFFMPVMDGLDCVREYRQWEKRHRPWFRQYIVGISAHAGNKDVGLGSELGMDDFKAKPVVVNALKELVESEVVIRKSQQLDKFDSAPASRGTLLMDDAGIDQKRGESSVTLPVCLIVTPDIVDSAGQVLERNSWKYDVTRDHKSAMTSLRLRNYEAVLFDEDLEGASGFVTDFRAWEAKHRVKRQTNIFFLSSICETASSGDEALLVQPPSGFDGAIRKQILWNDFENLMRRNKDASYSSLNYIISR
jgi:CheY-like chemotaxis protein